MTLKCDNKECTIHVAKERKMIEQLMSDHFKLCEQSKLQESITRRFISDVDGIIQSILGNAELLKIRQTHKLNHEAMNYLRKIENNSENLIVLLNRFQNTIHSEERPLIRKDAYEQYRMSW